LVYRNDQVLLLLLLPLQKGSMFWGTFDFDSPAFDWGADYNRPQHHMKDLIMYEMTVRCFTADASSGVEPQHRGTYLGVADKVGGWGVSGVC
jgi:isoamylase